MGAAYSHHFVSKSCAGEKCQLCKSPATHKVEEAQMLDDPLYYTRHHSSTYVCCHHFKELFPHGNNCPA